MISILIHIYYPGTVREILEAVAPLVQKGARLYINFVSPLDLYENNVRYPAGTVVLSSSNKGKDIGGKLLLLQAWLLSGQNDDFLIFLHDKKSDYTPLGNYWKNELFRIIDADNIDYIYKVFNRPGTGIVASAKYIRNEYDRTLTAFSGTNSAILQEKMIEYAVSPKCFEFVAGTMFWTRAVPFRTFFEQYAPMTIRASLEPGNVTDTDRGTQTHAWERMFTWITTKQGYSIHGI